MHVGIDLGTTNSTLATFDGTAVTVVPNAAGESLTPSVVRLDARGNATVGRRAFRFLETDPANTRAELKRLMGTGERIAFEAAGKGLLPEEVASLVLASLLADAHEALGFTPRAAVISLIAPLIERSVEVCRLLLDKARVAPDAVERVVFVGGPTLPPSVRERVCALFGGRIAEGVDPMTLVARGAALYAATAGLEARPRNAAAVLAPAAGLAVRIEHPAVTADPEPFVVGRFLPGPGEALPARVRIEREGGGFVSPEVEVSAEGSFVLQIEVERHRQSRFLLIALTAEGAPVALRTPGFAVVHGLSVADPPLSRTVGVACADNSVSVYFKKGTPLPARLMVVHQTITRIAAGSDQSDRSGQKEDADGLLIPVVQGEYERAHLNRLIGTLRLSGAGLREAVPAGTRIEITLHLDRSGQLRARADLPSLGQSFEDVVHVLVPRGWRRAGRAYLAVSSVGYRPIDQQGTLALFSAAFDPAIPDLLLQAVTHISVAALARSPRSRRGHGPAAGGDGCPSRQHGGRMAAGASGAIPGRAAGAPP